MAISNYKPTQQQNKEATMAIIAEAKEIQRRDREIEKAHRGVYATKQEESEVIQVAQGNYLHCTNQTRATQAIGFL